MERCIDDELPFEIPDSWEWVRLGTVFQHNTGKALNASNRDGEKLAYITTSNLYWDRFVLDIQGLSSNAIHNLLFPLPPLHEQERIVSAIDTALSIAQKL